VMASSHADLLSRYLLILCSTTRTKADDDVLNRGFPMHRQVRPPTS
jgi:hypothetical protein